MCRWLPESFNENSASTKRALIIGIQYAGHRRLQGSIRDIRKISYVLRTKYGYKNDDLLVLTDAKKTGILHVRHEPATREQILNAMKSMLYKASPTEKLFLYYAGHGERVLANFDGGNKDKVMEDDGFDESIVPQDHESSGVIIDDLMYDILVKPLPKDCSLTAIFDCCHSGSMLDLPYIHDPENNGSGLFFDSGQMGGLQMVKEAKDVVNDITSNLKKGKLTKAFNTTRGFINKHKPRKRKIRPLDTDPNVGKVVYVSACKDDEKAIQTSENAIAVGALTDALTNKLVHDTNLSLKEILYLLRDKTKSMNQTPQLSFSKVISIDEAFDI